MIKELIIHQWKSTVRSPSLSRDRRSNIFIGFLVFIMILNFFFLGLFMNDLLNEFFPDKNPVTLFNGFIVYYLLGDLFVRLMLQAVPGMSIQPYLHLNISRATISHYLLLKSLGSVFNYMPFAIIIPFALVNAGDQSPTCCWTLWIFGIFLFLLFNAYLVVFVKRRALDKPILEIILGLVILALGLMDYYGVYSITGASASLFTNLLNNPLFLFPPVIVLGLMYGINFQWLRGSLSLEQVDKSSGRERSSLKGFDFLDKWGEIGLFLQLELKLIVRNKRLKQAIPGSLAMLLLGFVIYGYEEYQGMTFFLIYMGILFNGMFMVYYGQFVLSWESHYFDKILTEKIDLLPYIKAKCRIMQGSCLIFYFLLLPFSLFGEMIFYVNSAVFLFNIGINAPYLLWTGTSNRERIDLSASYFTWQGKKGRQIGIVFILILLPLLVYLPVKFIVNEYAGLMAIAVAGLIGLLYSQTLLKKIAKKVLRYKYEMAEGFRQLS